MTITDRRPALLEVEDLRVHLATRTGLVKAVDGVSFSLREEETLGLVGESGCGKTMTCLALIRLLPKPAARILGGRVLLDGEDLLRKSEAEMRAIRGGVISMILQDPMTSLNPVLSIGDQVEEPIKLHQGLRGRPLLERVIAALRMLGIPAPEARVSSFPHQLSGGMRQRVVGAAALSCEPRLLIADEPTTALDVTIQAQYLALLKELQRRHHLAIIFVTHDFGIVRRMCDRVAVMYAGRIVEEGPVTELLTRPRHPYTAALLASVPKVEEDAERLHGIEGQPPDLRDLPVGCRFAPRCPLAEARCQEYPPTFTVGPYHSSACWNWERV